MHNGILTPTKDEGSCEFNTDLDASKITVTVRAPMTIDKRSVDISITELLEIAAHVTIKSIEHQRALHARLARETAAKRDA